MDGWTFTDILIMRNNWIVYVLCFIGCPDQSLNVVCYILTPCSATKDAIEDSQGEHRWHKQTLCITCGQCIYNEELIIMYSYILSKYYGWRNNLWCSRKVLVRDDGNGDLLPVSARPGLMGLRWSVVTRRTHNKASQLLSGKDSADFVFTWGESFGHLV